MARRVAAGDGMPRQIDRVSCVAIAGMLETVEEQWNLENEE